jgi:hypothetical protein
MFENIFEILSILGGIIFFTWAWRSLTRQGKHREVSSMIGEGLMKPFGGKAKER